MTVKIELGRDNIIDLIDTLIDQNQEITTDIDKLQESIDDGVNIE